jgi:hypothetical protein
VRQLLIDRYEETAATLEFMHDNSRERAEMLAFGDIVVQLLGMNIDRPQLFSDFQEPYQSTD